MKCKKCGGNMVGNGYDTPIHCETLTLVNNELFIEEKGTTLIFEADCNPVHCDVIDLFTPEPGDREPFFPAPTEEETWQCEGCAQVLPAKDMFEAADAPSGEVFRFCNRCYHNNP